jgi:DtxR family Mn-dependent transcriptional regulator
MSDLIDTTEMYLRTIYELIEDGVVPMRARIADQLGHSGPTVSQTIARMERDGLVLVREGDHRLEFTPTGRAIATRVMRKHRLAERLLTEVIGLGLQYVHDEACRWEHVMSDLVEERLLVLLGGESVSPYGNVVPGLDELGVGADAPESARSGQSIERAVTVGIERGRIARVGEPAQSSPGILDQLVAAGVLRGADVTISTVDGETVLATSVGSVAIDDFVARHIFLES